MRPVLDILSWKGLVGYYGKNVKQVNISLKLEFKEKQSKKEPEENI